MIHIALNNSFLGPLTPKSNSLELQLLYAAIWAAVGHFVTIWAKKNEFKNSQDNLDHQKKIFEEDKKKHINDYNLSLKKIDFEHLKELLDYSGDKNEKRDMIKEFNFILNKFNSEIPAGFDTISEHQQSIASYTYSKLDEIIESIKSLLEKHVITFSYLHKDFQNVASQASNILNKKSQLEIEIDEVDHEYVVNECFDGLLKIYADYNNLLERMKEEFMEIDKINRDYILNFKKK